MIGAAIGAPLRNYSWPKLLCKIGLQWGDFDKLFPQVNIVKKVWAALGFVWRIFDDLPLARIAL